MRQKLLLKMKEKEKEKIKDQKERAVLVKSDDEIWLVCN